MTTPTTGVTTGRRPPSRIWLRSGDATIFAGSMGALSSHRCGAPVLLIGLYDPVRITRRAGHWSTERSVVVAADEAHEIDGGGAPVACLWLEPSGGGEGRLRTLFAEAGALRRDFRDLFEQGGRGSEAMLRELHAFARPRTDEADFDPRVAAALERMMRRPDEASPVSAHARAAGVSSSQFQRLFTRVSKAPFRRYRGWLRLMNAVTEVRGGASLTTAAHAAGFADLAHFSRAYRAAFGAAPSAMKTAMRP